MEITYVNQKEFTWKPNPNSTILRHPFRRFGTESSTTSSMVSLEWYSRARGSSCMIAGGSLSTLTTRSVTSRVLEFMWKKAVSENPPTPGGIRGSNTWCSMSSPQGASLESGGISRSLVPGVKILVKL